MKYFVTVGAKEAGRFFGSALLDHYRSTLDEIGRIGYLTYARQQFRPYLRAAVRQFSTRTPTVTERLIR